MDSPPPFSGLALAAGVCDPRAHTRRRAPAGTADAAPTFTKDVLPILQRSCQTVPSSGHHRADVADDLSGGPAVGALDQAEAPRCARCRRGTSIAASANTSPIRRSPIRRSRRSAPGSTAARPKGGPPTRRRRARLPPTSEWTYGEPDLVVRMEKGFTIPADGPDFIPEEIVDPKLTEDRYVKWVQIIPDAHRAVHHSHVYVDLPEGIDTDGLGLGMGSNIGNSMDLIEYGAGNDADIFPDGTTKILKKGSLFRFESHYHPYGEETFDRQKVGIKFYPKGVVPKYVVTSHRIRTGVGNDWVLNRERIEDLLLRAGHKLSIDEPTMPTGALIAENPLHARGVAEHSAQHGRAPRALLAAAEAGARSSASSRTCTSAARA